ncbi:MAG: TetR/AcrR family transcriptional regulator [Myxococcales bacterium]|nr:TetR/AcrR family transcriptional regulator [Myxococcales bacterium]MCB9732986.1 TetR/AcrR family transcriptional regulator [Deltaproteobacteria bacterium]
MGRIKGRKPEETREAVLDAATRAFAEHGYANATLGQIAEAAGVTAATLPYHFKNKEGLFEAVVDGIYKDLASLGRQFAGPMRFADVVRGIYDWAEDHRDGIRVMLRAILEKGGLDEPLRTMRLGPTLDAMARLVSAHYRVPENNARECLVAVTHLVMRFATNLPEDNMVALAATDPADGRERVIALMAKVGAGLLGIPHDA